MRKPTGTLLLALCAGLALAAPAAAGPSIPEGTIHGRVFDRTCYGPCYVDQDRKPFQGDARVDVYSAPGHQLYGSAQVEKSRFRVLVPPGNYRVRVTPYPSDDPQVFNCWQGSTRRVTVQDATTPTRVRLTVENVCIA